MIPRFQFSWNSDCNEPIIFCSTIQNNYWKLFGWSDERTHKLISNQHRGATSPSAANDFTKLSTPSSLSRAKRSGCLNFTTRGLPLTYQTSKYIDVSRTDVCVCICLCARARICIYLLTSTREIVNFFIVGYGLSAQYFLIMAFALLNNGLLSSVLLCQDEFTELFRNVLQGSY